MKKAVIFDLWNTLIRKKGENVTGLVSDHFKLPRTEVHEWLRVSSVGKDGSDRYKVYETLCLANNVAFGKSDKQFIDELFEKYATECEWTHGAKETLSELKRRGFKIGILSNTTALSHHVIKKFGVLELVDEVVFSCDVGYLKPDPRIFRCLLNIMGLSTKEVYMVGDKITTDLLGAMILNIDTIYYNVHEKESYMAPNISINGIVNNVSDILKLIKE